MRSQARGGPRCSPARPCLPYLLIFVQERDGKSGAAQPSESRRTRGLPWGHGGQAMGPPRGHPDRPLCQGSDGAVGTEEE